MRKARLLIVYAEPSKLAMLTSMLKSLGHEIDEAASDRVALRLMERSRSDLLVAGVDPQDAESLELLAYIRRRYHQVPVILLFSVPHPERAKEALRQGALAVLNSPVPAAELRNVVTQALGPLPSSPGAAPASPQNGDSGHAFVPPPDSESHSQSRAAQLGMVGDDPTFRQVMALAAAIAATRSPVLIVGEPGTGKALLARTIHQLGSRGEQPFIHLDCASRADDRDDKGLNPRSSTIHDMSPDWFAKLAQGGTLYIDEVAALPEEQQGHLCRILQGHEFGRAVNGSSAYYDSRFLMSTSERLLALVDRGEFYQDLFHRTSVICLALPPLRHRGTDIVLLAEYFRIRYAVEYGKDIVGFTRGALDLLNAHDWPGNVRELESVVQRGVVLCQEARITREHLASNAGHSRPAHRALIPLRPLREALGRPERRIIIQTLQTLNWSRQETARVLDINRTTLYKKMKKYDIGPML